jgi:hypothetical protein
MSFDARSDGFNLEIEHTTKIPEVITIIEQFIEEYSSASDKTTFKNCVLVTYAENNIASASILDNIDEESCILAGSFNPPHYEHIKLMKDCSDFFLKNNKKNPQNIFELSIVNADKGTIDINDIAARLLYFTQPLLGGSSSENVTRILFPGSSDKPFFVAITVAALFSDKKEILCKNEKSVFCAGIDTVERIIMPKYYPPVKNIWDQAAKVSRSITGITEAKDQADDFYSRNMLQIPLYVVGRTVNGVKEYLSTEYVFEYEGDYKPTKTDEKEIAEETAIREKKNKEKAEIMEKLKSNDSLHELLSKTFTIVTTKDGKPLVGNEVASSNIRDTKEFKELEFRVDRYLLDIDGDFQPILSDFKLSSAWMKRFIFSKAGYQSIGIGFVGTGGGANIFDYLFRSGSSAAMVFADFEYHQNASYEYCKEAIQDIASIDENSKMIMKSDSVELKFVSTIFTNSLAVAGVKKLLQINNSFSKSENKFNKLLTIACSADYSNPRFCISLIDSNTPTITETYAYAYKKETNPSRDTVSNTIVIEILRVLCNYIYNIDVKKDQKITVYSEKVSFSKLDNREQLLLLQSVDDKFTETQLDLVFKTTGGKKKKSTRRKRNKFNSKSRRAF